MAFKEVANYENASALCKWNLIIYLFFYIVYVVVKTIRTPKYIRTYNKKQ